MKKSKTFFNTSMTTFKAKSIMRFYFFLNEYNILFEIYAASKLYKNIYIKYFNIKKFPSKNLSKYTRL